MMTYFFIYLQESDINDISREIRRIDSETPSGKDYPALNRALAEQQAYMRNRSLFPLIVKDVAHAIQSSGTKLESLEIKSADPKKPTKVIVATIRAKKNAYSGWLEEEPVAKALLGQSVTMSAIRRPPGNQHFVLEGLIEMNAIGDLVANYQDRIQRAEQQNISIIKQEEDK